ncbi:ParM/StbA family protein [Marininema halotolerans]|uniref:Plasmid segregation protein ParM n=1 Tax=Marininema halotolerans TaxID=1155944 RepID=A0A1I6UR91_9BACL|nr:hypothetical protein [Marininema halotolerans]SFT03946.1 plasmid segregation protein ParM [Marininema halotolerans]
MILGIDAGGEMVKVFGGAMGHDSFPSDLGEWRDRRLVNTPGQDDMEWEYEGQKGFAGTLAQMESELGGAMKGETKAHFDGKMRVLLAIHRFIPNARGVDPSVQLVTGQPISHHTEEEKSKIIDMLTGKHDLIVNGQRKIFRIKQVKVAAEGAAASMAQPVEGLIRILDIGSGTVNGASLLNMRYIDRESFTEPFGLATLGTSDESAIARRVNTIATSKKWKRNDLIRLIGGGAEIAELVNKVKEFFPNAEVFAPKRLSPKFSNAVGFYEIGLMLYG